MNDGVQAACHGRRIGMLPDVAANGDACRTGGHGVFHHLEQTGIIAHRRTAKDDHRDKHGIDDALHVIDGPMGRKGGFHHIRAQLSSKAGGKPDVFHGVLVRLAKTIRQRLNDGGHIRIQAVVNQVCTGLGDGFFILSEWKQHVHHAMRAKEFRRVDAIDTNAAGSSPLGADIVHIRAQTDALAADQIARTQSKPQVHHVTIHIGIHLLDQLERVFQPRRGNGHGMINGQNDGATVTEKGFEVFFASHRWR